jgi:hypothetical protein
MDVVNDAANDQAKLCLQLPQGIVRGAGVLPNRKITESITDTVRNAKGQAREPVTYEKRPPNAIIIIRSGMVAMEALVALIPVPSI